MIAYRYLADRNPAGAYLPGVPLADLTADDVAAMPAWLQASIVACPYYETVAPGLGVPESAAPSAAARQRLPRPSDVKADSQS